MYGSYIEGKKTACIAFCLHCFIHVLFAPFRSHIWVALSSSFGPVACNRKQVTQRNPEETFRRVHTTIVAVETQHLLHILNFFVTLYIQQAIRMRLIVIHGLP